MFTHELVRHRVGTSISQESLRFVRLDDLPFWFPDWAQECPLLFDDFFCDEQGAGCPSIARCEGQPHIICNGYDIRG